MLYLSPIFSWELLDYFMLYSCSDLSFPRKAVTFPPVPMPSEGTGTGMQGDLKGKDQVEALRVVKCKLESHPNL